MIKPTVGRVVWFYTYIPGQGYKGPQAALVAYVHSDTMLNLSVADENGNMQGRISIQLIQEGQPVPQYDHCTWMPYQIGQAKKETT